MHFRLILTGRLAAHAQGCLRPCAALPPGSDAAPPGSLCLLRRIGEGFRQRAIPRRDCQKPFRGARIPLRRQKAEPRPPRVQAVAQNAPRPLGRQFRRRRPQRVPDRARRRTQKVPSVLSAARVPIRRKPDRRPARVCQHPKPARPDAPFLPSLLPRPRRLFALFSRPAAPKHVRPSSLHPWFLLVPFSPPMRRIAPAPQGMPAVWLTAPPACAASFSSNSRGASPFLHCHAGRSFFRQFPSPASPPGRSPRPMPFAPITTVPSQVSLSRSRQSPANAFFSLPAYHAPAPLSPAFRHPGKFSASKLLPLAAPFTSHRPLPAVRSFRCLLAAVRLPCRPLPVTRPRCRPLPAARFLPSAFPAAHFLPPASCRPPSLPPASCHSSSLPPDASSALFPTAHCIFHSAPCRLPYPFRPLSPHPSPYTLPAQSCPMRSTSESPPRLPALCPAMPFISTPFLPSPFSFVFSRGKEHSPARAPC